MKKKWISLCLCLALAAGTAAPALAAGVDEHFPATTLYQGFPDVSEGDWFYDNVRLCYEIGLMQGTGKGFEPAKTLTVAEVATIAARIHCAITGGAIPAAAPGQPWYQGSVDYLWDAIIRDFGASMMDNPHGHALALLQRAEEPVLRRDYLAILDAVLQGAGALDPINTITALPDTDSAQVLRFYNAGILTGVDKYGTFAGEKILTRAECAAMVSRIARWDLRMGFTPADATLIVASGLSSDTVMFTNGVTAGTFLPAVNNAIAAWEVQLGPDFNWHTVLDGKTVLEHVKEDSLAALGVTAEMGTDAYKDFDYQVYYSRLIDRLGTPLG